jgi:hypothetical protein
LTVLASASVAPSRSRGRSPTPRARERRALHRDEPLTIPPSPRAGGRAGAAVHRIGLDHIRDLEDFGREPSISGGCPPAPDLEVGLTPWGLLVSTLIVALGAGEVDPLGALPRVPVTVIPRGSNPTAGFAAVDRHPAIRAITASRLAATTPAQAQPSPDTWPVSSATIVSFHPPRSKIALRPCFRPTSLSSPPAATPPSSDEWRPAVYQLATARIMRRPPLPVPTPRHTRSFLTTATVSG